MDPGSPNRRQLPLVPGPPVPPPAAATHYSPSRQALHLEEMANPYQSPTTSPQRAPGTGNVQGGSPQRGFHRSNLSVHGSPKRAAEWTRMETPVNTDDDHMSINIDDDQSERPYTRPPQPQFGPALGSVRANHSAPASELGASTVSYESQGTYITISDSEEEDDEDEDVSMGRGMPALPDHMRASMAPTLHANMASEYAESFSQDDEQLDVQSVAESEATLSTQLYDAPEKAQPRRHKSMTRKEVKLVRGNLILDCPVPTKLYSFLPRRDNDEFVYMRYTACTSDPDHFMDSGFTLRQAIYEREIQLCVCITMYNEDEVAFTRTFHAVMKNIAHLCSRERSRVWGKDSWKKVVVTIVSDGREKIHQRVLDSLAAMGVFQDGIAKNFVNGDPVTAHIFEYTTQVSLDSSLKFQGAEKGIMPVQVIFCLKERNQKKINSHRWLFNAFCPLLNPNVCVLLDVGTKPGNDTLYHLWKAFDADSNVAGACGEIKAQTGKAGINLLNPLVAAQNFEYKMSNILDKPMESAFGYISVLPGALSAYRYRALKNHADGTGPLASYFKGEKLHGSDADIFTSNMYLAEDRILCWELVAKRDEKWVLKYVAAATGETDVPDSVPEFISQRRRWLNGALFAAIYSQTHFRQIWKTDHSFVRKFFFHIEFIYQFFNLVFTFFSLANFYLAFYFVAGSVAQDNPAIIPHNGGLYLFLIFKYICILSIAAQFILSLGNRPQGAKHLFMGSMILLGVVACYSAACGIYFVVRSISLHDTATTLGNNVFSTIVVSLCSTYGLYVVMSFLYLDPWHIFTCGLQYFVTIPSFLVTLQIYAFCNTHDVSWGTKGDNLPVQDLGSAVVKTEAGKDVVEIEIPSEQLDIDSGYEEALTNLRENRKIPAKPPSAQTIADDYYREIRTRVVLVWVIANGLLAMLMTQIFGIGNTAQNVYLQVLLWSVAAFAAVRALGSIAYLIQNGIRYLSDSRYRVFNRRGVLTQAK